MYIYIHIHIYIYVWLHIKRERQRERERERERELYMAVDLFGDLFADSYVRLLLVADNKNKGPKLQFISSNAKGALPHAVWSSSVGAPR